VIVLIAVVVWAYYAHRLWQKDRQQNRKEVLSEVLDEVPALGRMKRQTKAINKEKIGKTLQDADKVIDVWGNQRED